MRRAYAFLAANPYRAIFIASVLAVILSSYPVVFFGKSFVSPNHVGLYRVGQPTVAGYSEVSSENLRGADVGALMWVHVPSTVVESKSILHDHEFPLWNRFNNMGLTLLGQSLSMIGDPLNILVVLSGADSLAWDLKFLAAKLLFSLGVGLSVFMATRHLPTALMLALSANFIGFFAYRFNHPAIFSVCYSPWILYCWYLIRDSTRRYRTLLYCAALMFANWMVMNSGTAKEAYMLLAGLNLSGCLMFALTAQDSSIKRIKALMITVSYVLFFLISMPIWMSFVHTLANSFTVYDEPKVFQTSLTLMIGLFDNLFYMEAMEGSLYNPAANFLILLGVLLAAANFKKLMADKTFLALCITTAIYFALVFGIIPPAVISALPIISKVYHIHNTFSCVMVVQLAVIAGYGIHAFIQNAPDRGSTRKSIIIVSASLAAMLLLYLVASKASVGFTAYALMLSAAAVTAAVMLASLSNNTKNTAAAWGLALCLVFLHIHHGMHLKTDTKFDTYVANPLLRASLQVKSAAAETIKQLTAKEPARVIGFGYTLTSGFSGVYGLENFASADAVVNKYYREFVKALPFDWQGSGWHFFMLYETSRDIQKILDFANLKYYLETPRSNTPLELPWLKHLGRGDLDVYASDSAWPRAFFTDRMTTYNTLPEFLNQIQKGDGRPFASILSTDAAKAGALLNDLSARQAVPASNYRLTNNTTTFTVEAPGKGVIVLDEMYLDDDFKVTVNDKPASYFRVNHIFKGVTVDAPGRYTVSFSYWPKHMSLWVWMSALGLIAMLAWVGYERGIRPVELAPVAQKPKKQSKRNSDK